MTTQLTLQIGPLIITGTQIGPLLDVRVRTATESAGMSMTIAEWSQLCGVVTVLEAAEKEIGRLRAEVEKLQARYGWNESDGDGVMVAKKILTSGWMAGEDVDRICRAHLEQAAELSALRLTAKDSPQ